MNKRIYSMIIIIYTVFNISMMFLYDGYGSKNTNENVREMDMSMEDEQNYRAEIDNNESKENSKEDLGNYKFNNKKDISEEVDTNKNNYNFKYESDEITNNISDEKNITRDKESSFNSSNYYNKNKVNKVFNSSASEIIKDLTAMEKAKVLVVCTKLSREEYKNISEYLSYNNERLGVLKVYDILEKKLDDESLEELKEIFFRYMDVDKVKEIR